MPAWMNRIDDLSVIQALGMGLLLTVANPKNLGLTIAAAANIGSSGHSTGEEAATVAVFVLLASITIIVPVVGYLAAKDRAVPVLDSMKVWLGQNNATVMTVLFLVLGAKVLGTGVALVS